MGDMKAIVLAAGLSSRIKPLSLARPKPLLPIAGKPLIKQTIRNLIELGFNEIGVVIGYMGDNIKKSLEEERKKTNITFIKQTQSLGTGDALSKCEEFLKDEEKFLVIYGDITVTKEALNKLLSFHRNERFDGSLIAVEAVQGKRYGIVESVKELLNRIYEKSEEVKGPINSGIYILPKDILEIVKNLTPSPRGEYELTDALNILVKRGGKIGVLRDRGEWWFDIGRPEDYLRANFFFLKKILNDMILINNASLIGSNIKLEGPCIIDEDVILKNHVKIIGPTVIGKGTVIENNSTIASSVILEDVEISKSVEISYAIIGEKARLGANTIVNENDIIPKLVVAPGAQVPPNSVVKAGSVII